MKISDNNVFGIKMTGGKRAFTSYRPHCNRSTLARDNCNQSQAKMQNPIYVQAQQPEDRLESVRHFPFYSIQNLHV